LAVSSTGITPAANFLPTFWASKVSDATQATTVLSERVDRSYEDDLTMGRVVNIQDASNPATRFKSEDTTATWANITETRQSITISKDAYSAMLFENIAEIQSSVRLRELYTGKMGYALTATIEGDGTSGLVSLGNSFSQGVGTLGVDPTDDDLIRANQYLADADVPTDDGLTFWVSPACYAALLKIDKFVKASYVGAADAQSAVRRAELGNIYDATVLRSSLANANPSSSNSSYNWYFHKRAVALIVQQMPTVHSQWVILEEAFGVYTNCIYNFAEREIAPSTLGGGTSGDQMVVAVSAA
jgi:hypothetical protein